LLFFTEYILRKVVAKPLVAQLKKEIKHSNQTTFKKTTGRALATGESTSQLRQFKEVIKLNLPN